jgi:hypothetical protein
MIGDVVLIVDGRALRMMACTKFGFHIMDSKEEPGGIGEPTVVNAIFALTGKLPVDASELKAVQRSSN